MMEIVCCHTSLTMNCPISVEFYTKSTHTPGYITYKANYRKKDHASTGAVTWTRYLSADNKNMKFISYSEHTDSAALNTAEF